MQKELEEAAKDTSRNISPDRPIREELCAISVVPTKVSAIFVSTIVGILHPKL